MSSKRFENYSFLERLRRSLSVSGIKNPAASPVPHSPSPLPKRMNRFRHPFHRCDVVFFCFFALFFPAETDELPPPSVSRTVSGHPNAGPSAMVDTLIIRELRFCEKFEIVRILEPGSLKSEFTFLKRIRRSPWKHSAWERERRRLLDNRSQSGRPGQGYPEYQTLWPVPLG